MTVDRVRPESHWGEAWGGLKILVLGIPFAIFAAAFVSLFGGSAVYEASFVVGVFVVLGFATYWVAMRRNEKVLFDRTWVSTEGMVDRWMVEEKDSSYGVTIKYYLNLSFTAGGSPGGEDRNLTVPRTSLRALVSSKVYASITEGEPIAVRYSSTRPALALVEGEWS